MASFLPWFPSLPVLLPRRLPSAAGAFHEGHARIWWECIVSVSFVLGRRSVVAMAMRTIIRNGELVRVPVHETSQPASRLQRRPVHTIRSARTAGPTVEDLGIEPGGHAVSRQCCVCVARATSHDPCLLQTTRRSSETSCKTCGSGSHGR